MADRKATAKSPIEFAGEILELLKNLHIKRNQPNHS